MTEDLEMDATKSFADLDVSVELRGKLAEKEIVAPVDIQRMSIPPIRDGRDVIMQSGTGTGKTLAYVLPILERLDPAARELQWLIIVPTQELAMQIVREIESLVGSEKVAGLIGGASLQRQLDKLKTRPVIAVGTPGRLVELYKMKKLRLHHVKHVVVDEVDQVFSLGGQGDVKLLLTAVPRNRQLVFVSATVTEPVRQSATDWMTDPLFVIGKSQSEATERVRHEYIVCDRRDKIDLIRRWARTVRPSSALIFVKETELIGELESKLKFAGLQVESIYGEAGKQERANAMRKFASGKLNLLIATDVAARGIDVTRISHIVNFEPPESPEQYIHRAGRTGRMGREGTVMTLVTAGEQPYLARLAARAEVKLHGMRLSRGEWEESGSASISSRSNSKSDASKTTQRISRTVDSQSARANLSPRKAGSPPRDNERKAESLPRERERKAESPPTERGHKAESPPTERGRKVGSPPRERDRKNKGAPRWLKEKNNQKPK